MKLKEARKKEGMTQADVCRILGVSLVTFQIWEKGIGYPNAKNAEKLRNLFGDIDDLQKPKHAEN